jgi:hypothetical protein
MESGSVGAKMIRRSCGANIGTTAEKDKRGPLILYDNVKGSVRTKTSGFDAGDIERDVPGSTSRRIIPSAMDPKRGE